MDSGKMGNGDFIMQLKEQIARDALDLITKTTVDLADLLDKNKVPPLIGLSSLLSLSVQVGIDQKMSRKDWEEMFEFVWKEGK